MKPARPLASSLRNAAVMLWGAAAICLGIPAFAVSGAFSGLFDYARNHPGEEPFSSLFHALLVFLFGVFPVLAFVLAVGARWLTRAAQAARTAPEPLIPACPPGTPPSSSPRPR